METVLSKDEQVVESKNFTTNLILNWLKTDFTLTNKRIVGSQPNTLFGLIPLGKAEITFPLKNVSGVGVSTQFYFKRFLFGAILALIALGTFGSSFLLGLILLVLGSLLLVNSYTASLKITNNAGQSPVIEISILEKDKIQQFANKVNSSIADLL